MEPFELWYEVMFGLIVMVWLIVGIAIAWKMWGGDN